jgi:HEAT repeat protein
LQAALALAEVGDPAGLEILVGTLDKCPTVALCRLAILALGKLRDGRAAPALIAHLREVQNRHEMATALGDIAAPLALRPLAERLAKDEYVPVRSASAHALARLGLGHAEVRAEVRRVLDGALATEREATVREAIEAARAALGRPRPSGAAAADAGVAQER